MAQRQNQGARNNRWENDFIPESFFDIGTLSSPGVPAGPSNINNQGQFTSTNPTLFRGPENPNISAGPLPDHTLQTPFSIDVGHGTNSKLHHQGKELVEFLLHDVKEETLDRIKKIEEETKRLNDEAKQSNDETKRLNDETKRLNDLLVEMTAAYEDLGNKLWTQLRRQLEYNQRRPVVLMPYQMDNNKTPQ
ncbi:hypothetical protein B0O99DRAFT_340003 [Bisporella sp. PMI_857]|nr:hypothetical protein B0O99DRAFT_340003 [Bisporella sp. PMI_857]